MKINVKVGDFRQEETDAIALGIYEGEDSLTPLAESVDQALGGAISNLIGLGDFEGKLKQVVTLYTNGKVSSPRISLVGCGKVEDFNQENLQENVKGWITNEGIGFGKVMQPLRLSLVGEMKGPDLFHIMTSVGKEETLKRIDFAIEKLG